jgi:hypothetical protein
MGKACSKNSEKINAYNVFEGKPDRRRLLRRPKHRWEDNITIDSREIELGGMDWIYLAQDREQWGGDFLIAILRLRFLSSVQKFLSI